MSARSPLPRLDDDASALFERSVLCWLATADADGRPSVSPKEIFVVESTDKILIAHIASPHSVRNVGANDHVCVAAVDIFEQRGYQVFGRADVIRRHDADFGQIAAPLITMAGSAYPLQAVIRVTVQKVTPILAPSLWMYPDIDAAQRRLGALRAYGVIDAPSGRDDSSETS